LQVGCPFCYAMNPVDEEFCGNCGANVQNARSRKVFWLEEKRRHDEERWVRLRQAEAESRKTELNRLLKELEEPENHTMAIFCLHQFGVEAVEGLLGLLQTSDDPDARFGAAQTLGRIGDPRAVESLIAALRDPEPVVRYWAVDSLGRMRVESVAKEIGNMVEDEHKGVAAHAVKILRGFKTMEAKRVLREKRSWL
jgi:HEAT repeat protein